MPPGRGSSSARCPIQSTLLSGSTRNSHTVSGFASMMTSRSIVTVSAVLSMLSPLLPFRFAFERLQPFAPELLEELLQLGEAFGAGPVETPCAVASFVHEPG